MCILLLEIWLCRRDIVHLMWCALMGSSGFLNAIKTSACGDYVQLGVIKTWLWTYTCVIQLTITFSLLFTSVVYLTNEHIHVFLKPKFKHDLQRGKPNFLKSVTCKVEAKISLTRREILAPGYRLVWCISNNQGFKPIQFWLTERNHTWVSVTDIWGYVLKSKHPYALLYIRITAVCCFHILKRKEVMK